MAGCVTTRSSAEPQLSRLDGFTDALSESTLTGCEWIGVAVEERERQPDYTARPKTMAVIEVGFSRILWENSALLPV